VPYIRPRFNEQAKIKLYPSESFSIFNHNKRDIRHISIENRKKGKILVEGKTF